MLLRTLLAALPTLLVAPAGAARPASYIQLELFELAGGAHLVVAGTIERLDERTFDLRIEETIAGRTPLPRIRVERFRDWPCAQRWTRYSVGQRVVLFLAAPDRYHRELHIMGAGNEGELPLDGGDALLPCYRVPGYPPWREGKAWPRTSRVPLAELTAAVRGLRRSFRFGAESRELVGMGPIEALVPDEELRRYALSSDVARFMYEGVMASYAWEDPSCPDEEATELERCTKLVALRKGPVEVVTRHDVVTSSVLCAPRSCCFVGDVDGDGAEDLALDGGGALDRVFRGNGGPLWIVFLDERGRLPRPPRFTAIGGKDRAPHDVPLEGRLRGFVLAPLGDLDLDGVPDLAVAVPGEGGSGPWVLFLRRDGTAREWADLGGELAPEGRPVTSLACLGDLDHDGTTELVVGPAPLRLFSLSRDGHVERVRDLMLEGAYDGSVEGSLDTMDGVGDELAALGDVDGDGTCDLALSGRTSPFARPCVLVARLDPGGGVLAVTRISDRFEDFEGLDADASGFARSLAAPGDLDGDAVPELVVGGRNALRVLFLDARGEARDVREVRLPPSDRDRFGRALAAGSAPLPDGSRALFVGGSLGGASKALWRLALEPDGSVRAR